MEENKEIKKENKTEKKQIQIKLSTFIVIVIAVTLILAGIIYCLVNSNYYKIDYQEIHVEFSNNYNDTATHNFNKAVKEDRIITNYEEYLEIIDLAQKCEKVTGLNKNYSENIFNNYNIAMVSISKLKKNKTGDKIMSVELVGNIANITAYIDDNYYAPLAASEEVVFFVLVPKEITKIISNV